ncbi:hypothetical protein [Natrinema altunense]|uniref:PGF-CTERM sorting domain-containing protein n=1 Tax=Natrinema altunense (strain JCM 12890 / CGMCC 1.3731 / AJ2) TaxID=1227494 RepID=M0A1G7_NATA2|nr:hypothetical protein [Natrinema altunense]ELY91208.1 hypothetical protein C485_02364 [Natrinema altunense JCM 12890]
MDRYDADSEPVARTRTNEVDRRGRPWRRTIVAVVVALAVGAAASPGIAVATAGGGSTLVTGATTTSAADSSLVVADATVEPGGTATHRLALTDAPNGLAGFEITLELSTDGATISNASYPDTYGKTSDPIVSDDGQSVTVEAADLTDAVTPGATDVTLATVAVTGPDTGSTTLEITDLQIDADGGSRIEPALEAGTLTVDDGTADSPSATAGGGGTGAGDSDDDSSSDSVPGFAGGTALVALAAVVALLARAR